MSDVQTLNIRSNIIMTTVIWYSSVCHYPLLRQDSETWWVNLIRTLLLFILPTLVEAYTEIQLVKRKLSSWNAVALLFIWITTCPIIYLHVRLSTTWNHHEWALVLNLNWIRVFLWTVKFLNTQFYIKI